MNMSFSDLTNRLKLLNFSNSILDTLESISDKLDAIDDPEGDSAKRNKARIQLDKCKQLISKYESKLNALKNKVYSGKQATDIYDKYRSIRSSDKLSGLDNDLNDIEFELGKLKNVIGTSPIGKLMDKLEAHKHMLEGIIYNR